MLMSMPRDFQSGELSIQKKMDHRLFESLHWVEAQHSVIAFRTSIPGRATFQIFSTNVQALLGYLLKIEVINYGRGYYNASQEMVLLIDLLKAGHRPDLVIFMDGVNWGPEQDVPYFTEKLASEVRNLQSASDRRVSVLNELDWIPMIRLTNSLKQRLVRNGKVDEKKVDKKEEAETRRSCKSHGE